MATPDAASIIAAFGMPPEAAIAYLSSKGLQVSDSWRDLWRDAHARAFTVARTAGYDVLQDIRDALVEALDQGKSMDQFIADLKPTLQAKGWWGKAIDPETGEIQTYHPDSGKPVQLGSARRLRLIYDQNAQTAFMAGRYNAMMEATETHPYWEYVAVLDNRTRPAHRAMAGLIFRHDDPFWSVAYPPNGWRCRCRVRPVSAASMAASGRSVRSAVGYIHAADVPLYGGATVKVQRIKLPGEKPFQPDPGWDYNPAADFATFKKAA